ncbi:hypothetical protein VDGL01_05852 [Verticillium dahliae]
MPLGTAECAQSDWAPGGTSWCLSCPVFENGLLTKDRGEDGMKAPNGCSSNDRNKSDSLDVFTTRVGWVRPVKAGPQTDKAQQTPVPREQEKARR